MPRVAIMLVCLAVANDPEPLLSLSMRLRTLGALSRIDRDTRDVVKGLALPQLEEAFAPVADRHRYARAEPPTLETLARRSDRRVMLMQHELCCCVPAGAAGQPDLKPRSSAIDRILEVAARFWHLVSLKRELRRRRGVCMKAAAAIAELRLRRADVAACPTMRREELLDAALARHGSSAGLARADAALRTAAVKRTEARDLKAGRRAELEAASGAPQDWKMLLAVRVELVEAVRAYAQTGAQAKRAAALDLFSRDMVGVAARRAEIEAMPWPPIERRSVTVRLATEEYALYAGESDLASLTAASASWAAYRDAARVQSRRLFARPVGR